MPASFATAVGVTGVPCFIIDNKYAVMGAQSVDVLTDAFREIAAMKAEAVAEPVNQPSHS